MGRGLPDGSIASVGNAIEGGVQSTVRDVDGLTRFTADGMLLTPGVDNGTASDVLLLTGDAGRLAAVDAGSGQAQVGRTGRR